MKAEYTGVKIILGDEEKIITPKQAEELRDALVQLLGQKPFLNALHAYQQYAEQQLRYPFSYVRVLRKCQCPM